MVADISTTTTPPNSKVLSPAQAKPKRVPLLPSGSDNNARLLQRRPISKDVTSRYLSCNSSSKHNTEKNTKSSSNSAWTPRKSRSPSPDVSATLARTKMLMKTSARSLSVSFQGESFALPVSKAGRPTSKPEKKKCNATTAKKSPQGSFMAMSVDFSDEKMKLSGTDTTVTKLEHKTQETVCDPDNFDYDLSDTESISSGSTARGGGPRAIVVPARFWHETISLLRRVQQVPVSAPLVRNINSTNNNKQISGCKDLHDGPKQQPRGSSVSSRMISNVAGCNGNLGNKNTPSIMSFCVNSNRGKVGETKVADAHVLKLLHNKHMQWRFANAKAEAAMVVRRAVAQKSLYNAWVTVSKLWHSVISKRLQMQQLKHNLKLHSLVKKQMVYLDNWDLTERGHSISLAGATETLESSCLCLPVLCGAKVDIQELNDAIYSATNVMQAMSVSIYSLATKVQKVNSMASELANVMEIENFLLDQCKDMLSILTNLEKQECSLRTHTLQLIPRATMTQQRKMVHF